MERALQFRLRTTIRWAWIYFLYGTGLLAWARRKVSSRYRGIIVLTLHRVLDDADVQQTYSPRGMIIRRLTFEKLLGYLQRNYESVALTGVTPSWDKFNGKPRFALTFDDGWKDTADIAVPLSENFEVPVTVFVCPGLAGQSSPFWPENIRRVWLILQQCPPILREFLDSLNEIGLSKLPSLEATAEHKLELLIGRLKALTPPQRERFLQKALGLERECNGIRTLTRMDATMTWEDTARLRRLGTQIGSHTHNHQILPILSSAQVYEELCDSKIEIERHLGHDCRLFAYPDGAWSATVRELVIQAGYTFAFANETGVWTSTTDCWVIPRVNIWEGSVTGPKGRFSPVVFQYATFWRSFCAEFRTRNRGNRLKGKDNEPYIPLSSLS